MENNLDKFNEIFGKKPQEKGAEPPEDEQTVTPKREPAAPPENETASSAPPDDATVVVPVIGAEKAARAEAEAVQQEATEAEASNDGTETRMHPGTTRTLRAAASACSKSSTVCSITRKPIPGTRTE